MRREGGQLTEVWSLTRLEPQGGRGPSESTFYNKTHFMQFLNNDMWLETVLFVFLGNEQMFRRKNYIAFVYLLKPTSLQKKSDFDFFAPCL